MTKQPGVSMANEQNCRGGRWAIGASLTLSIGAMALSVVNRICPATAQAAAAAPTVTVTPAAAPAPAPAKAVIDKQELQKMMRSELLRLRDEQVSQAQIKAQQERVARQSSVASTLQTLRAQLQLYRLQHNDALPTLERMSDWSALLKKTDVSGESGAAASFGPYFEQAPRNAITGKSKVAQAGKATASSGWTYEP